MNRFVDYQKRGIELPEGCKELVEVLQLAKPANKRSQVRPPEGLADVGYYLSRLLSSAARFRSFWIHGDPAAVIALFCDPRGLRALVLVDLGREQAVRRAFAALNIPPIQDDLLTPPHGPCSRALIYSLPLAAFETAQFVRELLTKGLGLAEDVVLEFEFHEKSAA